MDFIIKISAPGALETARALSGVGAAGVAANQDIVTSLQRLIASATDAAQAQSQFDEAAGQADPAAIERIAAALQEVIDKAAEAGAATGKVAGPKSEGESNEAAEEAGEAAEEAGEQFSEAQEQADALFDTLLAGVALDIGGRLVDSVAALPDIFRSAIQEGVQFNAMLESAQLSVAAIYRQFNADRFESFDAALAASGDAIDALKEKAKSTNATFQDLLGVYQGTAGSLFSAGITDVQQQIDTIGILANAVRGLVANPDQLLQETRAILTGNINQDAAAAKILNITPQDIAQAKEAGKLVEYINEKVKAFGEAGDRGAQTFSVALDNLEESITSVYGEISKPVFEQLKAAYLSLTAEINKPEVAAALKRLGFEVAELVRNGAGMVEWAVRNAGVLVPLAEGAAALAFALSAAKFAQIALAVGSTVAGWAAEAFAIGAHAAALDADTAATGRNVIARGANAAAGSGQTLNLLSHAGAPVAVAAPAVASAAAPAAATLLGAVGAATAIGTGLGVGANLGIRAYSASIEVATANSEKLRASLDKQLDALRQEVGLAESAVQRASARSNLEAVITVLKEKSAKLSGQDRDMVEGQIHLLETMLGNFGNIVGKRKEQAVTEKKIADEQQRQVEYSEYLKKANAQVDAALEKSRFNALSPREQFGDLRARLGAAEANFRSAYEGFGGNLENLSRGATPQELSDRASEFSSDEAQLNLKQRVQEIIELQGQLDRAGEKVKRELEKADEDQQKREADAANEETKTAEARADQQMALAIIQATAAGNDSLANALAYELKVRKEIAQLTSAKADEATIAAAKERLKLERQIAEQKEAQAKAAKDDAEAEKRRKDHEASHPYERRQGESGNEFFSRTGRIDARPRDTDPKGGLHGGGIDTSGLLRDGGKVNVNGTVNVGNWPGSGAAPAGASAAASPRSAAGDRLAGLTSVQDRLAESPSVNDYLSGRPSVADRFAVAPSFPRPSPLLDPLADVLGGTAIGGLFPSDTAAQGFAPGLPAPAAPSPFGAGASGATSPDLSGPLNSTATAAANAEKAAGKTSDVKEAAERAAKSIDGLAAKLESTLPKITQSLNAINQRVQNVEIEINNLLNGLY